MKIILILMFACAGQLFSAENMKSLHDIPLKNIDEKPSSLKEYDGKVLLLVNVASRCGRTPQYKGLEAMYRKYQEKGFAVIGFPCNDFGGQEPGTAEQIKTFCEAKFAVTFPLMAKLHVKGPEQHPLYEALTGKEAVFPGPIDWNFAKFLIGRDGRVLHRYTSKVTPEAPELVKDLEAALAEPSKPTSAP